MKIFLKYKYFGLLIFPLVIIFLSWLEADTRFSRDLSGFFPKERLDKKERVLYFLSLEEKNSNLSGRQKKELVRSIVRSSQRLQLPDGTKLGGLTPDVDLFLYALAKVRTEFSDHSKKGIGILGIPEKKILELENKVNAKIDRKFDILTYHIQYKVGIILYKELLSDGKSAKDAYQSLFDLKNDFSEWEKLEKIYIELHKKIISENT